MKPYGFLLMAGCAILALPLFAQTSTVPVAHLGSGETNTPAVRNMLADLKKHWADKRIQSITVLYIPRTFHFPISLPPKALDTDFRFLLFIPDAKSMPIARRLMENLDKLTVKRSAGTTDQADVRWGFIFRDSEGKDVYSLYLEGDGKKGVVEGVAVEFESDAFVLWADKTFGTVFEMHDE